MSTSVDGIYAGYFTGQEQGFAMFVFQNGIVTGADPLGVLFDGTYRREDTAKATELQIRVTLPPNTKTVQGMATGSAPYSYDVQMSLPDNARHLSHLRVDTPLGPVNVKLEKLRGFDV